MRPRPETRLPRRPSPGRRWLASFLVAARLLLVLATFQIAGGPHLVATILGDTACVDGCSDDRGDHGCPPDCPDCVCVHGHLPSTLPVAPRVPEVVLLDLFFIELFHDDVTPPSPSRDSLERPPRA